jgi:hypothetical protein
MEKLIKVRRLTYDPDFNIGQVYDAYQRTSNSFDLIEDPKPIIFKDGVGEYDFSDDWEKLSYNAKILSDGTVAKVGMLVYEDYLKEIHRIEKVKGKFYSIEIDKPSQILPGTNWTTEETCLRKATPEERKQYYKLLKS